MTTHYLDEAEELCDRVAIVDQGRIVALDTPAALKAAVPGSDTLEVELDGPIPEALANALAELHGVRKLDRQDAQLTVRVDDGARVLPRLIETVAGSGMKVLSTRMSRISLEDVFIQLTGRSLRDAHAGVGDARRASLPRRFS